MPGFKYPVFEELYKKDFFIDEAPLREILALGKEAAVPELEKIVNDVLDHFDPERPGGQEPVPNDWLRHFYFLHALYLLEELDAQESLPLLLKLLRKDQTFLEYWFADSIYEEMPPWLARLGRNQLPLLLAAVNDPTFSLHNRALVVSGLAEIAGRYPDKRPVIIDFFREYLRNVLGQAERIEETFPADPGDSYGYDVYTYLAFVVADLERINATELESEIRECFRQGLLDAFTAGTEKELEFHVHAFAPILDIFEKYEEMKAGLGDVSPHNPDAENIQKRKALEEENERLRREMERLKQAEKDRMARKYAPQPVASSALKVERNDPCPCGSGKKYKKCCMP